MVTKERSAGVKKNDMNASKRKRGREAATAGCPTHDAGHKYANSITGDGSDKNVVLQGKQKSEEGRAVAASSRQDGRKAIRPALRSIVNLSIQVSRG